MPQEEPAQGNAIASRSLDGVGFRGALLQALADDPAGPQVVVYTPPQDGLQETPSVLRAPDFHLSELSLTQPRVCPVVAAL